MADITEEPAKVVAETSLNLNYVNDNGLPTPTKIEILYSDDPVPTIDTSHLNDNLLNNDDAVNTPTTPPLQNSPNNIDEDIKDLLDEATSTSSKQILESLDKPTSTSSKHILESLHEPTSISSKQILESLDEPISTSSKQILESLDEPNCTSSKLILDSLDEPTSTSSKQILDSLDEPTSTSSKQILESLDEPTSTSSKQILESLDEPNSTSSKQSLESLDEPNSTSSKQILESLDEPYSTSSKQSLDSLDKPTTSISTKQIEDYKIGDIVWAKIGKYPYWPSIVCVDPSLNIYYKEKKKFLLHVRFCNDKGRRSWTTTTENYCGKFELLTKYPKCLSYLKNSKKLMDAWDLAVKEADNLLKFDGEVRIVEFFKTFYNSDSLNQSVLNSSEVTPLKVRTYSRKRSLIIPEQDKNYKIIKTENISGNCTSPRSIDIPLLSRSDDADSTVSDISMSYAFVEDLGLEAKHEIRNKRLTKTYPPKSLFDNKYDLSDSMMNSPESNENNSVADDNKYPVSTTKSTPILPDQKGLEKSSNSNKKNNISSCNETQHLQSSSNSKKTVIRKKRIGKENSAGRKSTTIKCESTPEPDTTESEASSKSETYSSVFLSSTKNKQLFEKSLKRACVVCKNINDTVKCKGPCQSYFHKECLIKSEERYHKTKTIPMNKIIKKKKKVGRRKRTYSKATQKNECSIIDVPQSIDIIQTENAAELIDNDDDIKLNNLKTLSQPECSSYTIDESILLHQRPDDLLINSSCNLTEHENTQSELESVNEDSIQGTSEEKHVDTSIVPVNIDEKIALDDPKYMCSQCTSDKINCFVCGLVIEDSGQKIACKISSCGKYYHEMCLIEWPQCQWIQGTRNNIRCVVCPSHVCHLCISDNPKSSCKTHFPAEKLTRCIKCPTAYHRSEYCLPAGCQVLTYNDIICSRHFEPVKMKNYHYNAAWCFICALGGSLICCDLCPSSFHIACLKQNPSEFEGGFTCEECQTGRYPLYGEIVWVKIGLYRWWPAQIVFPNQIPDTVNAIAHSVGQFAVRFFGSYDYYWVNRGRVFNFHEGDDENILIKSKMKIIDQLFQDAIIEAAQAHNAYVLDKDKNDAKIAKSFKKPPKFTRIKFNKPIGNVKNMEFDISAMTPCECDPTKPNPCGPGSDCINRMLMLECAPKVCPAGDKCNNQRFEKTMYPAMVPFLTKDRGWGLKTLEDIKEGSFVIEYVGDVIDEEEFQRRCLEMHQRNEQNYYFLTIDYSRTIDAGPKGNLSRFMNHSCEPNCVTQKWTVNGDTRIGLFALHDIPAGTELVFNYRLQSCSGVEKKPCQCGAARCSKFIGAKVEEEKKKVISISDVNKCKISSKNKRKPLKLKDNVSDSDKSKLSKIINISTTEKELEASNAEKIDFPKKSKSKTSIGKPTTGLKNENSEFSEAPAAIKQKLKNSNRNSTNMTKNEITVNDSMESEENVNSKRKLRNSVSTLSLRKLMRKDDTSDTDDSIVVKKKRRLNGFNKKHLIKTDSLPLPSPILTELSSAETLYSSEEKDHVSSSIHIKDMKTRRKSTKDLTNTEQVDEALENINSNNMKPEEITRTPQEKSRNSLTRLAKSRHRFLSKNDMSKESKVQVVLSNKKSNKERKNLKKIFKKSGEMMSVRTVVIKKTKMNKHFLQSKAYFKNNSCLICGKGHTELSCKNKKCPRVFHLSCMNKTRTVKSGFICPAHYCSVCNKRKVVAECKFCVESFCAVHVKGNIFKDPLGNGMLCTTHHPNKKCVPIISNPVNPDTDASCKVNITNNNMEPIGFAESSGFDISMTEDINDDSFDNDIDGINKEEYTQAQVIKDECDREYIHIGGFNVCNMSDLVSDQGESHTVPVNTDGDLFKPSLANVVIDIESASALYQPMENLQLQSIATDNKDSHDYANVHFIPDVNQTKNKWLAAEP